MMHQLLHNAKLVKLDLSSLVHAGAGGAYLPTDLLNAFKRRAMNIPSILEGSDRPCYQCLVLIATLQVMECLNVYDSFRRLLVYMVLSRRVLDRFSSYASCSGHVWGQRQPGAGNDRHPPRWLRSTYPARR